ncbi:hypothetical protein RFI_10279 [Reticulomyxa filosa]|uniref:Palmitoyltransferase n=1 Tax=Reticulomyxa filosa TaxID=46433 RepID=X6NKL7_RETFI|nr:hypothetical protein RFI_10279 [Reticulomyxa filosa]|eukprot:ETO26855.1 hypothetical protein RFI_10279 [Reticulomyxa filosa]
MIRIDCPWIGTCIGLRNYGAFSLFVNSTSAVSLWSLGFCVWSLYLTSKDVHSNDGWNHFVQTISKQPIALACGLLICAGMWFVIGLAGFHCYLAFNGRTTTEELRRRFGSENPFYQGWISNIINMCCQIPKSQLHIHHIRPQMKENEQIVNKQTVVYLSQNAVNRLVIEHFAGLVLALLLSSFLNY